MDETTGWPTDSLSRVEQAFDDLLASFNSAEDALFDCRVPVDLVRVMKDLRRVRSVVEEHAGDIRLAREVIGEDRPVAATFNRDGVPWPRSHETLTPRDLRLLSHRVGEVPADQLTTYRAEITDDTTAPLARVSREAPRSAGTDRNPENEAVPQYNRRTKPALEVVAAHGDLTGALSRLADGFKPDYGGDQA